MDISCILLSAAGAAIALPAVVSFYIVYSLHAAPRRDLLDRYFITPFELRVPFERVSFAAEDGVILRGWWLARKGTRRVIIGLSGRNGSKDDLIGIGTGLWRAGHNVLLFDFRDRKESGEARRSVGQFEQRDARASIGYARSRVPGAVIGLAGYSMGASVALLAAAGDESIRAVMADSAFASLTELIAARLRRLYLPAGLIVRFADMLNRIIHDYSLTEMSPVNAIGGLKMRTLIIHGTADSLIPVSHAKKLHDRAGPASELRLCEGADHCGAYFADRAAYIAMVARFFNGALSRARRIGVPRHGEGAQS